MDEREALAFVRSLGAEPVRVTRLEDSKHIFSHVEWHMIAYEVTVTAEFDGFHPQDGMMLVENGDLRARYAIPSAFAAYKELLK